MALHERVTRHEPEVFELTVEEWETAAEASLKELGLTYEELAKQARERNFTSAAAHALWVAIGTPNAA